MTTRIVLDRAYPTARIRRVRAALLAVVFVLFATDFAAAPVLAQRARSGSADDALVIASWNLTDAVLAGAIKRAKPKRKVWRNTFVPRDRVVREQTQLHETLKTADVVLLQGVHSIREARKLFPARRWKLIVSRAILKVARGRGPYPRTMPEGFATTAIAVRYKPWLRVTGQQHLLELGSRATVPPTTGQNSVAAVAGGVDDPKPSREGSGAAIEKREPGGETAGGHEDRPGQAGLAVRIFHNGQVIWLVSVGLPGSCSREANCLARTTLDAWIEDKHDFGFPVVVGGNLFRDASGEDGSKETRANPNESAPRKRTVEKAPEQTGTAPSAQAATACARQNIVSDPKLDMSVSREEQAGCIALARILRKPARDD